MSQTDIVYHSVKINWKVKSVVMAATLALLCCGCGGFSASRSISPASFFIPGGFLMQADPQQPSSNTVPTPGPVKQFAQVK